MIAVEHFLDYVGIFYLLYLLFYSIYLFSSIIAGGVQLHRKNRMMRIRNELKHDYYLPVSIIVPAYNEEVTIVDAIISMLKLKYKNYEIIIVDDGSKDDTTKVLVEAFSMWQINRPIHKQVPCTNEEEIYETYQNHVHITLIRKANGGKGDALNMGINASEYPYFVCVDADSMLQEDSLEKAMQPIMEGNHVVAVAGLIRIAQCVSMKEGKVEQYRLPNNLILCMQVMEYDRSFLASRILMNSYNGNLIISGAFGLFKKDIVIHAGGYDRDTLGEDMELAVKLHVFCRNNQIPYDIRYEPGAICWSQGPSTLHDLAKQRRRWHLGLFQCMSKYHQIFANLRFGKLSFLSYMYYLFYELLSPVIEIFGIFTIVLAIYTNFINVDFMIFFFLLYTLYGAILTLTAFFQRIYTHHLKIRVIDVIKAIISCVLENVFFRFFLSFVRMTAFIGYKRKKRVWGEITREKQS